MRTVIVLLLSLCPAAAMAQTTMYKCTDEQRRITYSNETCEKQGLKDAGPVPDRVTSVPFTEPPKPAARKDGPKDVPKDAAKAPPEKQPK